MMVWLRMGIKALIDCLTTLKGNADAAWAMCGTSMRLAQSLGLHSEYGMNESISEKEKTIRRRLWYVSSGPFIPGSADT